MDASERTCGSGFLVDTSGIIITNAHVVDNALQRFKEDKRCQKKGPPLRVMLQNGQSYDGEVLSLDRQDFSSPDMQLTLIHQSRK